MPPNPAFPDLAGPKTLRLIAACGLRYNRTHHLAPGAFLPYPVLPPTRHIQDLSPFRRRKTHDVGSPAYQEAPLQVFGIGNRGFAHPPEQHRSRGVFRLRPLPAPGILDMQDKLKRVLAADGDHRMRIRQGMVGGLGVINREACGPPQGIGHLFVVLQMEADKALELVEKRRFQPVFLLYVQGRMGRGLACLVEGLEPGLGVLKFRKPVSRQTQFGTVSLGHGDKVSAPFDEIRFFLGNIILHGNSLPVCI